MTALRDFTPWHCHLRHFVYPGLHGVGEYPLIPLMPWLSSVLGTPGHILNILPVELQGECSCIEDIAAQECQVDEQPTGDADPQ